MLRLLIEEYCIDFDQPDRQGNTPFLLSCIKSRYEISEYLLQQERDNVFMINGDARNKQGMSAFHFATSVDSCKLFLEYGLDLNVVNKDGLTPLLHHCQNGAVAVVEYLVSCEKCNL